MSTHQPSFDEDRARKNRQTMALALSIVFLMLAMAYASVPLYRLFCQITGYGGTTQEAEYAPDIVLDRDMTVRFDASTIRGLEWEFAPEQISQDLKIGQVGLAFYQATNLSDKPVVGTSTFNVTPNKAGKYFNKIECFCFIYQRLEPGQTMRFPVQYFIDPAMADDPNLADVKTVTLSYTFFEATGEEVLDTQALRAAQYR